MLDLQHTNVSSYLSLDETTQRNLDCYLAGLIQGALSQSKRFCTADLVGGRHQNWEGTPLQAIYEYHVQRGAKNPDAEAGKDVGRIVKNFMIIDPKHSYIIDGQIQRKFRSNLYAYSD